MANLSAAMRTPAAQNLIAAVAAGAAVLARPGRFPGWARRGLSMANTAGTAGSVFLGPTGAKGPGGSPLGLKPVAGKVATAGQAGSALAAAAGGLSLITSGMGVRLDAKIEQYLNDKGVRHPRVWMALGAIGLVYAIKTVQDITAAQAGGKAQSAIKAKTGVSPRQAVRTAVDDPEAASDTLSAKVDEFKDRAAQKLDEVTDRVAQRAGDAKEQVSRTADDVHEKAAQRTDEVADRAAQQASDAKEQDAKEQDVEQRAAEHRARHDDRD